MHKIESNNCNSALGKGSGEKILAPLLRAPVLSCPFSIWNILLKKQEFVVTHTICRTYIPASINSWVKNTPSIKQYCSLFFLRPNVGYGLMRFLDHTKRRITVGRTPLNEWSARRRDLYLTTHNSHTRQPFKLPAGFEPTIPASKRPQTYALDRAVTGIGCFFSHFYKNTIRLNVSLLRICHISSVSCKTVYWWVTTTCRFMKDILFLLQSDGGRRAKRATHLSLSPMSRMDLRFDSTIRFHGVGFIHVSK